MQGSCDGISPDRKVVPANGPGSIEEIAPAPITSAPSWPLVDMYESYGEALRAVDRKFGAAPLDIQDMRMHTLFVLIIMKSAISNMNLNVKTLVSQLHEGLENPSRLLSAVEHIVELFDKPQNHQDLLPMEWPIFDVNDLDLSQSPPDSEECIRNMNAFISNRWKEIANDYMNYGIGNVNPVLVRFMKDIFGEDLLSKIDDAEERQHRALTKISDYDIQRRRCALTQISYHDIPRVTRECILAGIKELDTQFTSKLPPYMKTEYMMSECIHDSENGSALSPKIILYLQHFNAYLKKEDAVNKEELAEYAAKALLYIFLYLKTPGRYNSIHLAFTHGLRLLKKYRKQILSEDLLQKWGLSNA